jgi:hypothetical protein
MPRIGILPLIMLLALAACRDAAQAERTDADHDAAAVAQAATDEELIAEAMSAGPASIAGDATIMAWPEEPGGEMRLLRAGTNGWVCFPSTPESLVRIEGEDPMCLDEAWQAWADAYANRSEVRLPSDIGIAYMLRGDIGASNVDPYAEGPTADNEWVRTGPHIMLIVSDVALLEGIPTDPETGGPYVMWRGTPYAHVMIPVSD